MTILLDSHQIPIGMKVKVDPDTQPNTILLSKFNRLLHHPLDILGYHQRGTLFLGQFFLGVKHTVEPVCYLASFNIFEDYIGLPLILAYVTCNKTEILELMVPIESSPAKMYWLEAKLRKHISFTPLWKNSVPTNPYPHWRRGSALKAQASDKATYHRHISDQGSQKGCFVPSCSPRLTNSQMSLFHQHSTSIGSMCHCLMISFRIEPKTDLMSHLAK